MKITMTEHDGCFSFDMIAETMEDAALLVRFGVNHTKEFRHVGVVANRGGDFQAAVVIAARKDNNNLIPKAR
jgi:hypothetical protein